MSEVKEDKDESYENKSIIEIFNQLEEHFKLNQTIFVSQKPHSIPKSNILIHSNNHFIINFNSKNMIRHKLKKALPLGINI